MEQNLTFAELGLSKEILQALEQKGYGYPTRIQAEAIPPFMQWKDVIAKAPTGTGTRRMRALRMAPAHMGQGSSVTYRSHSSSRQLPSAALAWAMASISA